MRPGGGKSKGGAFERMIAKDLSLWLTDGRSDSLLWRTHASGGLGTVSKKRNEYGDLMAIDDEAKPFMDVFSIECRHGKCIKVRDLIYRPKNSSMVQFIEEGKRNAKESGRRPLWIFRENGQPIMVLMAERQMQVANLIGYFPQFDVSLMTYNTWKKVFTHLKLVSGGPRKDESKAA
jgi:hypothetical protein